MILVAAAFAAPCEDAPFSAIAQPTADKQGRGVATGESSIAGKEAVGVRFIRKSPSPRWAWEKVLRASDTQDEWLPSKFGYELAEYIDKGVMYLRFDIGLLWGNLHFRRQVVVLIEEETTEPRFVSCWRRADPAAWLAKAGSLVEPELDWQPDSAGWWEIREDGSGSSVGYQWWTVEDGGIPAKAQVFGVKQTIPELVEAFEARAAAVAAGYVR